VRGMLCQEFNDEPSINNYEILQKIITPLIVVRRDNSPVSPFLFKSVSSLFACSLWEKV
jgi:hypothetical protein